MPSRCSRSPAPASIRVCTAPCSTTPARTRASTYSRERFSTITDSMPRWASSCESSRPAGPAPTMATWVRMVEGPEGWVVMARSWRPVARRSMSGFRWAEVSAQAPRARVIVAEATMSAGTSLGSSRRDVLVTRPSAAITSPSADTIGTASEQVPRVISSAVRA